MTQLCLLVADGFSNPYASSFVVDSGFKKVGGFFERIHGLLLENPCHDNCSIKYMQFKQESNSFTVFTDINHLKGLVVLNTPQVDWSGQFLLRSQYAGRANTLSGKICFEKYSIL